MIFNQVIAGSGGGAMHSLTRTNSMNELFDYDTSTWVQADKQVAAGDRVLVKGEAAGTTGFTYTHGGVTDDATKLSSQSSTGFIAVFTMPDADTVVAPKSGGPSPK